AGSPKSGGSFVGASLAALLALLALARGLTALARRLPRARGLAWRHGLAALQRPGGHAPRVVVALGVAVMLLVTVALLEGVLGRQIDYEQRREAPSFFFLDVQTDQVEDFARLAERTGGSRPVFTPVVRARLAAVAGAPATWVATTRVAGEREAALQNAVVAAFPNVTAIPLRDVLERVAAVLGDIAVAVRLVALFTLGAGVVVMAGALAATRSQRLYESVVLRTLGATRGLVARAFAVEYGLLGAAAGVGGTVLATVLAWAVVRWVLDAPWSFDPTPLL